MARPTIEKRDMQWYRDHRKEIPKRGFCKMPGCEQPSAGAIVLAIREKGGAGLASRFTAVCEEHAVELYERFSAEMP